MVTTIIQNSVLLSANPLDINSYDVLIVSQTGSIFTDSAESIIAAVGATDCEFHIDGTVKVEDFSTGDDSSMYVSETGSIVTTDNLTIGVDGGFYSDLVNHGTLTAYSVRSHGSYGELVNFGSIYIQGNIELGWEYGTNAALENHGVISGQYSAVSMFGNYAKVTNFGTISGSIDVESEDFGGYSLEIGPYDPNLYIGKSALISNSGEIYDDYVAIASEMYFSNSNLTVINTGTIVAGPYAIITRGSADTILNSGFIHGSVELGGGNDIFDNRGGTLVGSVAGGTGDDTYYTDDANLTIIETDTEPSDGDVVYAAVSFRLDNLVEHLVLLGTGNFNGFGNSSANWMAGNVGDNRLTGLAGNDTMNGDLGDDRMLGGVGNDTMQGGDGDDVMLGGAGNDTARGEDGDDVLNGLAGRDLLSGGAGLDTFVFSSLGHTTASTATADVISDFIWGEDHIDLSAIDAVSSNAVPNDAFIFIGTGAFSNVAGQLRYSQAAGYTNIELDVDGNSTVDGIVRLFGTLTITASDFVL